MRSSERHFEWVESLVAHGGPAPPDHHRFTAWLADTAARVNRGEIAREGVLGFWRGLGNDYLSQSMQGRGLAKRFGYAGDFEIIDDIYNRRVSADPRFTLWDRYFHAQAAAEAVRGRVRYLGAELDAMPGPAHRESRVLVLGAGPCRDVLRYLEARADREVTFLCVDRDPEAISHAARLLAAHRARVQLELTDVLRFRPAGRFDLIWSAGLFDYLSDRLFGLLLTRYARALAPGAQIVVGNFSPSNPTRHYMELVGDWLLHYRTSKQLLEIAVRSGFHLDALRVGVEQAGVNHFLHVAPDQRREPRHAD